jgi:hypothetical protein
MNTLKFLAVGSSLDSGRDVVGRYRVREASRLPKFDPDAEAASVSVLALGATSWWRRILNMFRSHAPSPTPAPAKAQMASAISHLVNSSEVGQPEPATGETPPVSSAAPLDPLLAEDDRLSKPVQREFRFEHVTVVCNDLHDADFEIVSMPRGRRSPAEVTDQRVIVHA